LFPVLSERFGLFFVSPWIIGFRCSGQNDASGETNSFLLNIAPYYSDILLFNLKEKKQ